MTFIIALLYIADFVNGIYYLSLITSVAGVIIFFVGKFFILFERDDSEFKAETLNNIDKILKRVGIVTVIAIFLTLFTPTKNLIYIAIGLKTTENVYENFSKTERFQKITEIVDLKIDEILKEAKNKK